MTDHFYWVGVRNTDDPVTLIILKFYKPSGFVVINNFFPSKFGNMAEPERQRDSKFFPEIQNTSYKIYDDNLESIYYHQFGDKT